MDVNEARDHVLIVHGVFKGSCPAHASTKDMDSAVVDVKLCFDELYHIGNI
jgi:hypothetical protein